MKSSPPVKRKDVLLIVLSAIDVLTGILSLVFTAIAIQLIAVMASGLTLFKAVKVVIQSEKTAVFVKPVAVYAVRKLTRSKKMKGFFLKLKENLKNNPITLITSIVELVVCGGLGFVLMDFVDRFSWAVGWKAYALAYGGALVVYSVIAVLTVYLGHDNSAFALIRKFVKALGGDKAVEVLDKANEEVIAQMEAEEIRKAAEAAAEEARAEEAARIAAEKEAKALEEQKIYQYALEQEEKKKAAAEAIRRAQLVNAYSAEFHKKQMEEAVNHVQESNIVAEVVNDVSSHRI